MKNIMEMDPIEALELLQILVDDQIFAARERLVALLNEPLLLLRTDRNLRQSSVNSIVVMKVLHSFLKRTRRTHWRGCRCTHHYRKN